MQLKQLQILVTSDIHGYIMPTTFRQKIEPLGLAKVGTLIEQLREEKPTILIDNGDLIQGSPLTYYHHAFQEHKLDPVIEAANLLDYDFAVFGNHEFNYGKSYLDAVIAQSNFPWLSGNITNEDGTSYTQPYLVKEVSGIRIGFIALTTHFVTVWEEPRHIEGLSFKDAYEFANFWITQVKAYEQLDLIALCYHGGFENDLITGETLEATTGENQGYKMCKELDFDLLITGHQHRELAEKLFGKSIIQPGTKGNCLGVITIEIEKCFDKQQIHHKPSLVYVTDETPVHEGIVQQNKEVYSATEAWLDETIGQLDTEIHFSDAFSVRVQKHPYIQLIQDIQMEMSGAPISCTALFHDQAGGFPAKITMRHIINNYIFPNTLKVLKVSGRHIMEALEQNATYFTIDQNNQLRVSKSFYYPKPQPYNYDMWEGIEYVMDIRKPLGQRITKALYNGEPLQPEAYYEVVMNNYRATGAGNFPYFAECEVIKDIQIDMTELIARYFQDHPTVESKLKKNWDILY